MPIVQQGSINATAQIVPNLFVQIVPPSILSLNGVPTNNIGIVGTASFGPVNTPIVVGNMSEYATNFGAIQNRKFDMGTHIAMSVQQGASNFTCVRQTDGTDTAATSTGVATCITYTVLYTGSVGNGIVVRRSAGSKVGTWRLTVSLAGFPSEVYDNIGHGLTGNAYYVAEALAINAGANVQRGKSNLIVATAGSGVTAVASGIYTFTGGTDGTSEVTGMMLVGNDGSTRTGMYALRKQNCSILDVVDCDDTTQWSSIMGFAQQEAMYAIVAGPQSDTIANAVSVKAGAGIDSPYVKVMFGDYIYWNDSANGLIRLVSPVAVVAGILANLSPEQSSLNKLLYNIVGTQKSGQPGSNQINTYSDADLQELALGQIDVITNPVPGGNYFGVRLGINSSSNAAENGDNYTRLTNYIATTLNSAMGIYIGKVTNKSLLKNIRTSILNFLNNMLFTGMLGSVDGSTPFSVVCDVSNNPDSRLSLGYVQADVQVKYQPINKEFFINLLAGQTVEVSSQNLPQ